MRLGHLIVRPVLVLIVVDLIVLRVLPMAPIVWRPLDDTTLWRFNVAVRRRAQILCHQSATRANYRLSHSTAALGHGAAVACSAHTAPQSGVVAAGVLIRLCGALNAAQVTKSTVHHLLPVIRH